MTYKHLVLEGSGVMGIAYIGALEELESEGILQSITHFAGSSSGSILATLLAMRFTLNEISKMGIEIDFTHILSKSVVRMLWNLYWQFGLFSTDSIIRALRKIISARHDPDITFAQLLNDTGNFLIIVVSSLTDQRAFYINPITHPDVKVIDAIRASISIPLFFIPCKHSFDDDNRDSSLHVDGGVLDNYPLWIFTQDSQINTDRTLIIPSNTLGLKIVQSSERRPIATPKNLGAYILSLVTAVNGQLENVVVSDSYTAQTIAIEIPDEISSVDFNITGSHLLRMYELGRMAVRNWTEREGEFEGGFARMKEV